jgi:transposase
MSASIVPNLTIGLDLGDRTSRTYEVDGAGVRQSEATVATTPLGMRRYFGDRAPCRVVLEASTHSGWVARELATLGHEVIVANPAAMFRGAGRRRRRNDALDAELLARQGRADARLLRPVTHRRPQAQQHLEVLKARDQLVRSRSQLITHVRCAVKVTGQRLPASSAGAFVGEAEPVIPEGLRSALAPVLHIITELTRQIREADRHVQQLIRDVYPVAERLQQPSGVGPITALAFVLLVDDPTRFQDSRDVGAYFGLVPRLDESSASQPQLRISKCGDALGRRLLVTASHYILGPFGPDCDLRRHGLRIAERGGKNAKKRAVVAVTRKVAVLLHRLWVSEQAYDPDHVLKHHARRTSASPLT